MVGFILFEGLSIHLVSRRLGHKSKLRSSVAYSAADVYYSAITPSATGGQPASAYYMVRDGMGAGIAGFTLVFNLVAYTAAVIVIGAFAFIVRPGMFVRFDGHFARVLVILGLVFQALLLGLCIACMFARSAVLKCGNGIIKLLHKIHLVKKPEKWQAKLTEEVEKFDHSRIVFKQFPFLFWQTLLLNIAQRVAQALIPCFICFAADSSVSFVDLFAMQAYVLLGYNFVPLPGGVGAYEYLYLHIFVMRFSDTGFLLSAMMVSRVISYYLCLLLSGAYTLTYHIAGLRKKDAAPATDEAPPADPNISHPAAETDPRISDPAPIPSSDETPRDVEERDFDEKSE